MLWATEIASEAVDRNIQLAPTVPANIAAVDGGELDRWKPPSIHTANYGVSWVVGRQAAGQSIEPTLIHRCMNCKGPEAPIYCAPVAPHDGVGS